jgi:hypothetical protein
MNEGANLEQLGDMSGYVSNEEQSINISRRYWPV